jgi:hypothetical protein
VSAGKRGLSVDREQEGGHSFEDPATIATKATWERLYSVRVSIPSIHTFIEDTKYLGTLFQSHETAIVDRIGDYNSAFIPHHAQWSGALENPDRGN